MMEYADTLPNQVQAGGPQAAWPFWIPWINSSPYLYYSSYGSQGYDVAGDVVGGAIQSGKVGVSPYNPTGTPPNPQPNPPGGTFIDVYRQAGVSFWAPPFPTPPYTAWASSGAGIAINTSSLSSPWNASSYQIISPGADHNYGLGGEYEQGDSSGLLIGARIGERDNITNFSSGTLAP
jgi:hypothetical protein